ncbi:uncharacterized protein LOC111408608 [Olea europaea var. sylvestris]|uniref:uncharacterized protein LOC111408608 n=1 Tax=Olea europaea var. sylvestris TaxID=158386 RepID=UPI000C1CE717|nr:uncharacterized protein LOC111408608 [Olea europaea var. sylvestris]
MVEMVSEFDPVMQEHLRRAKAREIQYTYFDASHEEQMSLIVRFVDDSANLPTVEEHWLEFLKVDDTTELGLANELQKALIKLDLDIDDIRGQGSDNGSNMSGKHKIVSFFGVIQCIYTLFSSSTKRCEIFKDNVQRFTVKLLSLTRWESHVESVRPIMEQTAQIRDALLDLAESNEDPKVKSEAESLATHELQNFEFLLGTIIWYRLLHVVNIVSKFLQTESMDINHAIDLLQGFVSFLEKYREIEFAIVKGKTTKSGGDEVKQSTEESFRVEYFVFIIDQALSSLKTRFEQSKQYDVTFGFLFNLKRLRGATFSSLLNSCMNLEKYLQYDGRSDITGDDLYSELQILRCYIPSYSSICEKKFLEIEVDQDLSPINYVARKIKRVGYVINRSRNG